MKQFLKNLLTKAGLYEYLKYGKLFHYYEHLFKPQVEKNFNRELSFYSSFIAPCDLVFDVGANDGHKTEAFLRLARNVVCCEPDQKSFKTLTIRFRNKKHRVFLENIAVGSSRRQSEMYIHHEGSAFNTLNEKFKQVTEMDKLEKWNEKIQFQKKVTVQINTLAHLIKKYGRPHFIKIDVEGYELEVIKGLDQPVSYLSMECLLPDFAEELQENFVLLQKLDTNATFNVAVNEKLVFSEFKSSEEINSFIKNFAQHYFELIVKMNFR